jgi:hypothetical protein
LGGEEKVLGPIHWRRQGVNTVRIAQVPDVGYLVPYGCPLHRAGDQNRGATEGHHEHLIGKIALVIQSSEIIDIFRTGHQTTCEPAFLDLLAYGIQALRVFVRGEKPVVIHDVFLIIVQEGIRLEAAF